MSTIEFLRSFRIAGYAIFDLAISFIGMGLLAPLLSRLFLKIGIIIPKRNRVFLTLPLAILVHILVGNITPMAKNFLDLHGNYILKIIIIASLIGGLYGIKIIKK
ncbi:MAG: hypothetical protein WCO66_02110 [Candidatus Absconditabacteria bacterium]